MTTRQPLYTIFLSGTECRQKFVATARGLDNAREIARAALKAADACYQQVDIDDPKRPDDVLSILRGTQPATEEK